MDRKAFKFKVKSIGESDPTGTFEGYASVFGNVDQGGDMVVKGAFAKTISDRGGKIKILWAHDAWSGVPIGMAKIKEDEHGLFIKGELFVDVIQKARDVYEVIKREAIDSMSFAYDVIKSEMAVIEGETVRLLKELKLFEVSPVVFAMNELANITDVKGLQGKIGQMEKQINEIMESLKTFGTTKDDFDAMRKDLTTGLKALQDKIDGAAKSTPAEPEAAEEAKRLIGELIEKIDAELKTI